MAFGQVQHSAIATVELSCDGQTFRQPVSAPEFAIRLDGCTELEKVDGGAWFNADGDMIWAEATPQF